MRGMLERPECIAFTKTSLRSMAQFSVTYDRSLISLQHSSRLLILRPFRFVTGATLKQMPQNTVTPYSNTSRRCHGKGQAITG